MNNLQVIELHNQRLLTTEQLAEFYEVAETQIKQNFSNNKEKFVEGKHFYRLDGEQLKAFKSQVENFDLPVSKFASQLYLWTKQGASRHSKMLGTDRAWDMFDELEESYFNPVNHQMKLPDNPMEILALTFAAQKETNGRVEKVEQDVKYLKSEIKLESSNYMYVGRRVSQKIYEVIRGRGLNPDAQAPLRKELNGDIATLVGVRTRSQIREKDFNKVIDFIDRWQPSTLAMDIVRQLELELEEKELGGRD